MIRFRNALFAVPFLLIACGGTTDDSTSPGEEDEIKKAKGAVGASCDEVKTCKAGLLCKEDSKGPPAGAVGLPLPAGSSSSSGNHFPPGAMGMPLAVQKHCAEPSPGEEGGTCDASTHCQTSLTCVNDAPVANSGPNFPPGAMGMPLKPHGTCRKSSAPPPGAMGMPLHP